MLTGVEHRGQLRQRPAGGRLWLAAQRADGGPQAENTANEARSSGLLDESTTSAVANSSPTTEALTAQAADPRTQLEATANSLFSSSLLAEFIATGSPMAGHRQKRSLASAAMLWLRPRQSPASCATSAR